MSCAVQMGFTVSMGRAPEVKRSTLVDVSYDLKRYKGKNYMNLDKEKNLQLVVAKSSYNNSWKLSAADDTYSMTAEVSYKSADETKSDFAKKTR